MYRCYLLLLLICCWASCKKKEESTCNYKNTVVFQCEPGADGAYTGYIDGVEIRTFYQKEIGMYEVDTGYHILSVKGGIPHIEYEDTVHLAPCETATMTFP